jgi:hypothetical protein
VATHEADTSGGAPPRASRSVGRRIGIALFWLSAAYVVGGAALSILPALYWPAHTPDAPSPGVLECARGIDALERALATHAADAYETTHTRSHSAWLAAWDRRYAALGTDCGPLEHARHDLAALRADIGAHLDEHERSTRPVRERVRRAVDAFLTAGAPGKT